ncbi:MAG: DNA translocase FtsK [Patescibacteria group bacterium]|nr:DNA translocase FtsK [Patescibacteria group bacterium]MDW8279692.1 DNA translocase FtsK [bacterium]
MPKSLNNKNNKNNKNFQKEIRHRLHPDTKKSIAAIIFLAIAVILILAEFKKAGPAGEFLYKIFSFLFGVGYFILPLTLFGLAIIFLISDRPKFIGITILGAVLFVLSFLGLIDLFYPKNGGVLGLVFGYFNVPFGEIAAAIINLCILIISLLIVFNFPIKIRKFNKDETKPIEIILNDKVISDKNNAINQNKEESENEKNEEDDEKNKKELNLKEIKIPVISKFQKIPQNKFKNYAPPPLDLLKSSSEKPTTGDLRANANIIKRTLESFGIPVEMGEINIGPKVTRYTLKPAEGVKLSRITALNQDLALALAAHPIRIEAPIPGKSLVGIEVPNKSSAIVRLGNLMVYPEFQKSGNLVFVLGRDVSGEPVFPNLEKMPHLLIAGATGSGKSVAIHAILTSFLYKNSPDTLKLILIDPKRVELSLYEGLPHLISNVVTDTKKAVSVFRWAISEMDRRYQLLEESGSRDIKSYNSQNKDNTLPYLVIVVDELADLMASFGREVEGFIVRLAQMARATGIHLILSTQRPSVDVLTGLIKANITARIALQVASQIDSRTILDMAGAEKLLGGGDLLFVSGELSKPKRIQGAYISEEETKKVVDFIISNNKDIENEEEKNINFDSRSNLNNQSINFDDFQTNDNDDELYEEAVRVVVQAKKASASLLQRRLKVGYARAARLLDIMEENGIIGPADGAKPREVYIDKINIE